MNLRKVSMGIMFNRSKTIQARLLPFPETQESSYYFQTPARYFSLAESEKILDLPRSCPGCGGFAQTTNPDQAGFYGVTRKAVQAFIAWSRNVPTELGEQESGPARGLTHGFLPGESNNHKG